MERIKSIWQTVIELKSLSLLRVGDREITLGTLFLALVILGISYGLASVLSRTAHRSLLKKDSDHATRTVIVRLLRYLVLLVGSVVALDILGIHLSTLFAAGAIFAVGIGFAMQNIAQNFVSGVILLIERTIKPGDVIEVDDLVVMVAEIGIRTTKARTRQDEELIIPNSVLVQSTVKNYTATDSCYLLDAKVGVTYSSDMKLVRATLEEVARSLPFRRKDSDARVLMLDFADSAVIFGVYVPITDPWPARRLRSQLHEDIWWAFQEKGIVIAFPQLDVHFDRGAFGSPNASGQGS
jgi:small-conductance mechanosensitive channel